MPPIATFGFRFGYSCLLIAAFFTIWGCAGASRSIKPPKVNIIDLRLLEIKPLETTLRVQLRIINPNGFRLTIRGIECDLELNEQNFGSGVSGDTATVPAFGSEVVSVVVYSSMISLVRGLLTLPEREQLSYKIKGSVSIAGRTGATSVPFNKQGKFDLKPPQTSM